MDPTIPPNHFVDFQPEPVREMPYTGPKPMRVLVPGKPMNRAYRRAEASYNKKAFERAKKAAQRSSRKSSDALGEMAAAQKALEAPLQIPPETATPTPPFEQESSS